MNLILFDPAELATPLRRSDPRARHLLEVLRRAAGDTFDAGLVNGPRGKGTLVQIGPEALTLAFTWGAAPPPPDPITLLVGLPRPQTARDILREGTALGVAALHFFAAEKSEPGYARSTLWSAGEWRRLLLAGAEQAFDTRLPEVTHGRPLGEILAALSPAGARLARDNYESPQALSAVRATPPVVLAFGPESGWSAAERVQLRAAGFILVHLGARVLRTETAVIAATAVIRAQLGLL